MVSAISKWRAIVAASLVTVVLTACSMAPSNDEVRTDFLREHPTYHVEFLDVGEGDGGAAYFHIRYRKPGDDTLYEDVWQYINPGKGPWRLNFKETLPNPTAR